MRPTNLLFFLVSFTFLCSALSVKEWKKFENGKVKIHKKQDTPRNLKDIPNNNSKRGEQHFLHGHHLARLKNREEKIATDKLLAGKNFNKGTKNVHHNFENSRLSEHKSIPNEANIPKEKSQIHKSNGNDEIEQKGLKAKQNKLNRLEKFPSPDKNEMLESLKENRFSKQDGKKKMGMTKMDGNTAAKKIWKHIIRDQVKAEGHFQIPKGNIPPPITSK